MYFIWLYDGFKGFKLRMDCQQVARMKKKRREERVVKLVGILVYSEI